MIDNNTVPVNVPVSGTGIGVADGVVVDFDVAVLFAVDVGIAVGVGVAIDPEFDASKAGSSPA